MKMIKKGLILVIMLICSAIAMSEAQESAITSNPDPSISYPYEQENPGLSVVHAFPAHITFTMSGLDGIGSYVDYNDEYSWTNSYFTAEKWELDKLLFNLGDDLRSVRDVAWFLGMHGYNVTEDGMIILKDGSQWQITVKLGWIDLVCVESGV
jgi:hypothetical protein